MEFRYYITIILRNTRLLDILTKFEFLLAWSEGSL